MHARGARKNRRRAFVVSAGVVAGIGIGCNLYDTSLLLPADDSGTAFVPDSGAPPGARWPERPLADDPGESIPSIVVAVRTIAFEAPDGGEPLGFDLDGVRTCEDGQGGSCVLGGGADDVCDGPDGRDNALLGLLGRIATLSPDFRSLSLSSELEDGSRGTLIELREYNGRANDTQLLAAIYASAGVMGSSRLDGGAGGDGGDGGDGGGFFPKPKPKPKWDGEDRWTVSPQSVRGGAILTSPIPEYVDENAYVADGVLVARITRGGFSFDLVGVRIELSDVIVTGRVVKQGARYEIVDGQMTARVSARSFLTGLAAIDDPFVGGGKLCGPSAIYQTLKSEVCKSLDLRLDSAQDGMGQPCDALSSTLGFTAFPAYVGAVEEVPIPPLGCGANYTDNCP